ncbi:MAG TPA: choice-of-anchor Q domain-containing protein, partial [Polyangia bacterium]|nr:choice-of-anchor Q domain-containing protein [Polyangia bacterium]
AGDGGTPVCDTTRGMCVGCLNDNDCAGDAGAAHVCDTMAKKCVQCVLPRDCHNPNAPICDNQICRGCKVDFECMGIGPEVCMSHVGKHCATDDETVYVKKTSCSDTMPSSGSKTLPFCNSQPAIDSANGRPPPRDGGTGADAGPAPLKNLVVMRGTDPLTFWTFNANRTLTVVGKDGAVIHGGAFEGITLGAGTLYLRDLEVSGGDTAGINATGGELHLDRVVAAGNRGGIFLDNTSFAITNSVIAGGTQAMIPNSLIVWSGIFIGTIPAAGPASLFNDTIVGNATGAVVCGDTASTPSRARLAGLILWGNSLDFLGNCTVPASCCGLANGQPVDPMLDSTYHLISGSPCINKLTAGNLTSYDFEGDPRPLGGASDCGADEFRPTTP